MNLTTRVVGILPRRAIVALSRVRVLMRKASASRRLRPLLDECFAAADQRELLAATDDAAVFKLCAVASEPFILKVAFGAASKEQIEYEAAALNEIHQIPELNEWSSRIARVLDHGSHPLGEWFTQSVVPGNHGGAPNDGRLVIAEACVAVSPLHQATAQNRNVDEELFAKLVSKDIVTVATWRPQLKSQLRSIEAELRADLGGSTLVLSRLHGDYAPTNVLWTGARGEISGIVDWKLGAETSPPEVDLMHFCLSLISLRLGIEYGEAVMDLLGRCRDTESVEWARLVTEAGPNRLSIHTTVKLAWLQHVAFGLHKAHDLRTNVVWLTNNIDRVVSAASIRP